MCTIILIYGRKVIYYIDIHKYNTRSIYIKIAKAQYLNKSLFYKELRIVYCNNFQKFKGEFRKHKF